MVNVEGRLTLDKQALPKLGILTKTKNTQKLKTLQRERMPMTKVLRDTLS